MERPGAALISLICVVFSSEKIVSGAEVEMRVRLGDNVTLYCDSVLQHGFYITWFRNCSHENQPPLVILTTNLFQSASPQYASVWTHSSQAHGLVINNVTESDLGLYYCAQYKRTATTQCGQTTNTNVYHYGNRTTRLSLIDPGAELPHHTPPVSDCSVCWKLLFTVCPVCVLLSSLLSSTCVYCFCHKRRTVECASDQSQCEERHETAAGNLDELCYASVDILSIGQNHPKMRTVHNSDFSTYSDVRDGRMYNY